MSKTALTTLTLAVTLMIAQNSVFAAEFEGNKLSEVSVETSAGAQIEDFRFVKCDYNFLGRILIRDGQFQVGMKGRFIEGTGFQITDLEPNSPLAKAGLGAGAIITNLGGNEADCLEDFEASFTKFDGILKLSYKSSDSGREESVKVDLRKNFIAAK